MACVPLFPPPLCSSSSSPMFGKRLILQFISFCHSRRSHQVSFSFSRGTVTVLVDSDVSATWGTVSPPRPVSRSNPTVPVAGAGVPASATVEPLLRVCLRATFAAPVRLFITVHELVHESPALICMWLRHSLHSSCQSCASLTSQRRSVPRHILFQDVPQSQLWRFDECFQLRHHHCRYLRYSHFWLFSSEHPQNSSTLPNVFVVPLLVLGRPLNSRASQQSTLSASLAKRSSRRTATGGNATFSPNSTV